MTTAATVLVPSQLRAAEASQVTEAGQDVLPRKLLGDINKAETVLNDEVSEAEDAAPPPEKRYPFIRPSEMIGSIVTVSRRCGPGFNKPEEWLGF